MFHRPHLDLNGSIFKCDRTEESPPASPPPKFRRMTQHLAAVEDEIKYEKPKAPQCETVIPPSKFVEGLDNCGGGAGCTFMLMKTAAKSKVMPPPKDDDEKTLIMGETNSPKESPRDEELPECGEEVPGSGEFRGNGAAEYGDELHEGDRHEDHKDDVPIESVEDGSKETPEHVEPVYEDGFMETTEDVKPGYEDRFMENPEDVKPDGFMEKTEDVEPVYADGFTENTEDVEPEDGFTGNGEEIPQEEVGEVEEEAPEEEVPEKAEEVVEEVEETAEERRKRVHRLASKRWYDKRASKGVPKCPEDAPATGSKARPKTKAAAKAKVKAAAKTKANGSMSSGKPKAKAKAKAKAEENHEKPVDLRCIKGEFIRSFMEDYSPDEPETRREKYQKAIKAWMESDRRASLLVKPGKQCL